MKGREKMNEEKMAKALKEAIDKFFNYSKIEEEAIEEAAAEFVYENDIDVKEALLEAFKNRLEDNFRDYLDDVAEEIAESY